MSVDSSQHRGGMGSRPVPPQAAPRRRSAHVSVAGLGIGAIVVIGALVVTGSVLHSLNGGSPSSHDLTQFWLPTAVAAVAYGVGGAWLAIARPRLAVGWLLLVVGTCQAITFFGTEYAVTAFETGRHLPGAPSVLWVANWIWIPGFLLVGAVLPLLLPSGRLPTGKRRRLLCFSSGAVALAAVTAALTPYDSFARGLTKDGVRNPTGYHGVLSPAVQAISGVIVAGAVLLALGSLWRCRAKADDASRAQLRWLGLGLLASIVLFALGFAGGPELTAAAMLPLPLACVVAVLRHRLWDVDLVLSRTLRYGLLLTGAGLVYLLCVGLLGPVIGRSPGAAIVAVFIVAAAAEPASQTLRTAANQAVFGQPDDPYEVLDQVGHRLAAVQDPAVIDTEVLPTVLRPMVDALRLPAATLTLSDGTVVAEHRDAAGVEPGAPSTLELPLTVGGESVGVLSLALPPGGLRRSARRAADDFARGVAVAVSSVLSARELLRSRRQIVTAREEERRQLHRELHDGFGPLLAASALQAETARDLVVDDPAAATRVLDSVIPRLRSSVDDVRAIVHGLRPATLDELGLPEALRELAARFASPNLVVRCDVAADLESTPAAVDSAVYRIVAEALTNATRHANATRVEVAVERMDYTLRLTVVDDGRGLPPRSTSTGGLGLSSMRQRVQELRGTLVLGPGPSGRGTQLVATLPLEES